MVNYSFYLFWYYIIIYCEIVLMNYEYEKVCIVVFELLDILDIFLSE